MELENHSLTVHHCNIQINSCHEYGRLPVANHTSSSAVHGDILQMTERHGDSLYTTYWLVTEIDLIGVVIRRFRHSSLSAGTINFFTGKCNSKSHLSRKYLKKHSFITDAYPDVIDTIDNNCAVTC